MEAGPTAGDSSRDMSGIELLEAGEAALARGHSRKAFELLERATRGEVEPGNLHRLATAFARAGRLVDRHADVLAWIEKVIAASVSPSDGDSATLLCAQISACRQLDLSRVLELAETALTAADRAGDEQAYASVLSCAAFAAYRRGDGRLANQYAERAATRTFTSQAAHYDCMRAQMFCATCLGDLEAALNYATKARAMARKMNCPADVANESNNLAESYLDLGCPIEACACAETAIFYAREAGHTGVESFGQVMSAVATAEIGSLDRALEQFDSVAANIDKNRIFAVDTATIHAYWLLERGAAGDADRALEISERALAGAKRTGVTNRLTALYSNVARACARLGRPEEARTALEAARKASARAEPRAQSLLALSVAEVLPVVEPKRKVALTTARARILRVAAGREDPRAFCNNVRLNRRLLELSGGVPDDLPYAD